MTVLVAAPVPGPVASSGAAPAPAPHDSGVLFCATCGVGGRPRSNENRMADAKEGWRAYAGDKRQTIAFCPEHSEQDPWIVLMFYESGLIIHVRGKSLPDAIEEAFPLGEPLPPGRFDWHVEPFVREPDDARWQAAARAILNDREAWRGRRCQ